MAKASFHTQQYEFAAHLRDPDNQPAPEDIEFRRMQIYRDLFFNNVVSFLAGHFPVLAGILGDERWRMLVRDWYRDHQSRSPLFPEVAREFLQYLAEERTTESRGDPEPDLPFMYELAHYEWVEAGLILAEDDDPDPAIDPQGDLLDGQPVLSGVAWGVSYNYAVNEINKDAVPDGPAEQPLHYLVYRNVKDKVVFTRLNVVSARLVALLDDETARTGRAALEQIASEMQHPDPETVISAGLEIMEKWRALGIIRGTLPA
jgi:hypothetical protein